MSHEANNKGCIIKEVFRMAGNQTKGGDLKKSVAAVKYILVMINIILILSAVVFSVFYSRNLKKEQEQYELDAFCGTIDSMKQVSDNYLRMELGYAKDWAQYINQEEMSIDEALDFINKSNHQRDRYAHIVDMETYDGYSSYKRNGSEEVSCYHTFHEKTEDTYQIFTETMQKMFSDEDDFSILGKYRADDTQTNVVSVGTRVTLRTEKDEYKDYLLLRVIPVESIRKIWVFPMEYASAEVGIITKTGAYVVPSNSMKSLSFSEFMIGYNFMDDYTRVDELLKQLSDTEQGVLQYKDSKGQDCYWYYSSFGAGSTLDILGYIPVESLSVHNMNWFVVIVICGNILLLAVIDGIYVIHMNRKLRETAKMAEEASRAKTQFLSTMSHDIRTPMNGIIGMTNIARQHMDEPEYVKECLDKVLLTSDHLLTLINDILDVSKVESGSMVLNPAVFSIERSMEKLTDIVQVQIEKKKLHFETRIDLPKPYLIADELRLNQIFINILTNAIKYTPEGGTIRMSIDEELLANGKIRLRYCVADNGIGMEEEFQKDMYHMFVRERDSRIEKIQGTGLGLAIVKQMVDLMDGMITCNSEVNKGTTFTVSIDLEEGQAEEYQQLYGKSENETDHFEKMKVLVAEDNDINWEISFEMLKSLGVFCERAQNGQECVEMLEAAKEEPYDLVFMDIQMPVMNGRQAARKIRQSEYAYMRNVMIIAMTADAFAEDVQACLDAGMDGHISKPVDISKVREVLRQAEQKKRENEHEKENE